MSNAEKALCCPQGCRALEAGRLDDCGAKLTKEHAEAAIKVCRQMMSDKRNAALVAIRKTAADEASRIMRTHPEIGVVLAVIVNAASDALTS